MKNTVKFTMLALLALPLASCHRPIQEAPENTRRVVEPKGSTDVQKPWNSITEKEGDAVMGIFGGMEQR